MVTGDAVSSETREFISNAPYHTMKTFATALQPWWHVTYLKRETENEATKISQYWVLGWSIKRSVVKWRRRNNSEWILEIN